MGNLVKLTQHFPYEGEIIEGCDITVRTVPDLGKIILQRSIPTKDDAILELAKNVKLEIPLSPCRASMDPSTEKTVVSVGPNMWDIICNDIDTSDLLMAIEKATEQSNIFATDMSDQLICIEITGSNSLEFLSRGCSLDLRKESFKVGHSVRSLLAQANVILWCVEEENYRLLFDVSLWNYLSQWIRETVSGLEV